jgi:hypothetical protein
LYGHKSSTIPSTSPHTVRCSSRSTYLNTFSHFHTLPARDKKNPISVRTKKSTTIPNLTKLSRFSPSKQALTNLGFDNQVDNYNSAVDTSFNTAAFNDFQPGNLTMSPLNGMFYINNVPIEVGFDYQIWCLARHVYIYWLDIINKLLSVGLGQDLEIY